MRISNFTLEKIATGSRARATSFETMHGKVQTPIFMPVGTQATVKTLNVETLKNVGSNVLLANTYHLFIRPGKEVFDHCGGIHSFMNWDRPVLTDSGGFQIFSLPNARKITEEGARFRSYLDGKEILLSPEVSIQMQRSIGSDIMMVLDECVPSTVSHSEAKRAMELTHRWAKRSLKAREDSKQALFAIVQGACFEDLRKESAKVLLDMSFDGYAIGGLAVGETREEREHFAEFVADLLPREKPRYLMGVGTPLDLLEAVHRGVDLFDCTIPVELAQRGVAFTSQGKIQIHRSRYRFANESLDVECACRTCKHYSKAYLHHLIKASEVLGWQLLAEHNLVYYHNLMSDMRSAILNGTFLSYYANKKEEVLQSDNTNASFSRIIGKKEKKLSLGNYFLLENVEKHIFSIQHTVSGEVMHSIHSPDEEANALYIRHSQLENRLREGKEREIVVWDVGLGAAHNAMAALLLSKQEDLGKLSVESFENDLDPLRLALRHQGRFPHLFHKAPKQLLESGIFIGENVEWKLHLGNIQDTFQKAKLPDVIFYDPFSYKTNAELWDFSWFLQLNRYLKGANKQIQLLTYSQSTLVRSALLAAGFYVCKAETLGENRECTIAYTRKEPMISGQILGEEWLGRWKRSDAKYPNSYQNRKEEWERLVLSHPQFTE
ncbi:tRNA-guanine transglycosylase, queuosine-34-forming [Leptospira ryugenii]|uniref:Queuine tRNA-ribosyltransferase n=1 Tax=Leptospira ryugenii TaxID=1917863 RepID=A0A2P2DYG3_9LEPT|nr:tRNA guanosine(34) transglycosylase Tgt [Leptospira ryugenii]GBF49673.1 tRNA-guanine transglycosylase, queuosine-34-forming [Leptospira ryugenii]